MKTFIEKTLGFPIQIEDIDVSKSLPLLYVNLYDFKKVRMQNVEWIVLVSKDTIHLAQLRKHHIQVEKILEKPCVFLFDTLSAYTKERMVEERIPFIVDNKEIYLPFLGVLLNGLKERKIKPVHTISFLTQKIILLALYERWEKMNVTEIAKQLEISKMSVTRCFDEIEFFELPILDRKGRYRCITIDKDKRELWNRIQHVLRNPVLSTFYLRDDCHLPIQGGISALSQYSMIEDNMYPTYVYTKKELKNDTIQDQLIDSKRDQPGCVIQKVGYVIPFQTMNTMDPLSLSLSFTEEEKEDERIEQSIREMLDKYVWLQD